MVPPSDSGFQFSLRELIGLALIVALVAGFVINQRELADLRFELAEVYRIQSGQQAVKPVVTFHNVNFMNSRFTTTSNIGMSGTLAPVPSPHIDYEAKLLNSATGKTVAECTGIVLNGRDFNFTLEHQQQLQPGIHPIVIEFYDQKRLIAEGVTLVNVGITLDVEK